MPTKPPSMVLRAQLRNRIVRRIDELHLARPAAGEMMGFTSAQMSRLAAGQDIFSLDRLVDAAAAIGLTVHLAATRHYEREDE